MKPWLKVIICPQKPKDYQFEYAVSDPHTGDHKSQWESKQDGVVRGFYSLLEPDGTTRIVEYIADDHGFRAVVKKIGTAVHPEPEPIVRPYDGGFSGAYGGEGKHYLGETVNYGGQAVVLGQGGEYQINVCYCLTLFEIKLM